MMKFFRLIVCCMAACVSMVASAQSNGDKLFMEGQTLQQTQTVVAQNQAIKKFQAAKVIYATAEKKKMCDNQIAICNKNIALIKKGGAKPKAAAPVAVEETKLALSQNRVDFDGGQAGTFNIAVTAPSMDWVFTVSEGVEGEQNFAKVTRSSDAKSIDIEVEANPLTIDRRQTVCVTQGNNTETLTIVQKGKPVTLSTSTNLVEFGLKGGNKSIELYTNSDSIIASNNDLTWCVESKPDWVETNVEVKKNKSTIGKGLSAIKGLVAGSASAANAEDVKTSVLKLTVMPLIKSDPEYLSGRRGEIVFASQDKRYKIVIIQQK